MNRLKRVLWVSAIGLACASAARADDEHRYSVAGGGSVVAPVPEGWSDRVFGGDSRRPATISFRPLVGPRFVVLLTPLTRAGDVLTRERLNHYVRAAAQRIRDQAVERDLPIREWGGARGFGAYFSATDRAPKSGEYKFMTQGLLSLGELRIGFTILTNDGQESIVAKALEMLQALRSDPAGA